MENTEKNSEENGEKVTATDEQDAASKPQAELDNNSPANAPSQQPPDENQSGQQNEQHTTNWMNQVGGLSEAIQNQLNIQDLKINELRVKVICLEKNNMALKLELKSAELQLEAKTKVDEKKTRLIELLDAKVQDLQKKKVHLMEMLETMLKEKDSNTHRLIDATKNMELLAAKLAESEKMKNELRSMNQELKKMLGNIEDKGSAIAKVAKEKLLKYKEESIKMQQQLDDMKKVATPGASEWPEMLQQNWKKIEDLLLQLEGALHGEGGAERVSDLTNSMKQELLQLRSALDALLRSNDEETAKLCTSLDSLRLVIVDLQKLSKVCGTRLDGLCKDAGTAAAAAESAAAAKDEESTRGQLQEQFIQLSAAVEKLADLSASVSSQ